MKRSFESLSGNRTLVAAALAASIVVAVHIVQEIARIFLNFFLLFTQPGMTDPWSATPPTLLFALAVGVVPFALGFFLCLWLLAPIAAELRLSAVIGRSLLAVAGGTVAVFIAGVLGSLFTGFDESAGLVFGWAYGALATATGNIGWAATQAVYSAIGTAISVAPLAILAGVLVWIGLRVQVRSDVRGVTTAEV